jgi:hypothetical protein
VVLFDFALAAGVATFTGNLSGVLVRFAISAAVFLIGHAGTGGVGALLLICHEFVSPPGKARWAILSLGCKFE